jgi:adenosylcobinamide-GDP ribazoletransferase
MTAVIAAAIGGGFAIISLGGTIIIAAGITVLATLGCGIIARAKIGGQTGDILGATQQICEMGLGIGLICALAL